MGIQINQLSTALQAKLREAMQKEDAAKQPDVPPPPPPPSKADVKAEKELQSLCELELNRRGIEHLHLSPRAREKPGWPDLTFTFRCNGERWPSAVELKTATGRLSKEQVRCLTAMHANGWHTYVFRSFTGLLNLLNGYRPEEWTGEAKHKPTEPQPKGE